MGIKYKVNEAFFDGWTPAMAYVLGYLYADGSLEDASYLRGKYIRVTSTDEITISRIKEALGSEHRIIILEPTAHHPGKTRYFLRIGSHKLYDSLIRLGLYPNKSLTVKFPVIPKGLYSHFIRGYFDGDGCISLYKVKGIKQPEVIKKLSVIFTSGSRTFLEDLGNLLKAGLHLNHNKIYSSSRAFQLRYSSGDSIKIFKYLYRDCDKGMYLERKFNVFQNYFHLKPNMADYYIKHMISKLS